MIRGTSWFTTRDRFATNQHDPRNPIFRIEKPLLPETVETEPDCASPSWWDLSAAAVAWIPRAALQILFLLSSDPSTGIGGSAAGCSWAVFSLAMDAICLCLLIGTTSKDSRQVSRQTFKTRDSPQNSRCKGRSPFTGRAGKWSPLAAMIID